MPRRYIGLVECGVGLIPGWGGNGEMLARWRAEKKLPRGPVPAAAKVFETISTATVSKSAHEAMDHKFLRQSDGITMNRDRLLADAKARALRMVEGYVPPKPPEYRAARRRRPRRVQRGGARASSAAASPPRTI